MGADSSGDENINIESLEKEIDQETQTVSSEEDQSIDNTMVSASEEKRR